MIINDEVNAGSCSDVCTEEFKKYRFKSCYVLKSTHSKLYSCVDLLHICQRFSGSVRIIFAPVMNCETAGDQLETLPSSLKVSVSESFLNITIKL